MPVFFCFLLASFPAGLGIYWAWNNSLSVLQQSVIMARQGVEIPLFENLGITPKKTAKDEGTEKAAARDKQSAKASRRASRAAKQESAKAAKNATPKEAANENEPDKDNKA